MGMSDRVLEIVRDGFLELTLCFEAIFLIYGADDELVKDDTVLLHAGETIEIDLSEYGSIVRVEVYNTSGEGLGSAEEEIEKTTAEQICDAIYNTIVTIFKVLSIAIVGFSILCELETHFRALNTVTNAIDNGVRVLVRILEEIL